MDPPLSQDVLNQMYSNDSWYIAKLPRFERVFEPRIFFSVIIYTAAFQFLSYMTKLFLWHEANGFRQYRLRNITICFVHSTICGLFVFYFASTRFYYMVNNPVFYNEPWMDQILLMSIGYFIHDSIDMSKYELSRWSIELLVHHFVTGGILMVAVVSDYFISFAYWSLLMEINSMFLHLRTLFQLSNAATTKPQWFTVIKYMNILTFLIFRFISPAIQLKYVLDHRHNFRLFYLLASFGTGVIFYTINIFLFIRIMASDGYLGEYGRKNTAIGRDKELTTEKVQQNGKSD